MLLCVSLAPISQFSNKDTHTYTHTILIKQFTFWHICNISKMINKYFHIQHKSILLQSNENLSNSPYYKTSHHMLKLTVFE